MSDMNGNGPGEIAPDGSAVEYYATLPPDEESANLIHEAIPAGASILELGAGVGRVTRPLLALGHKVTAVDESAAMLARIDSTETVCSRIEDLDLGRTFDAVLLMSHLVAYGDRRSLLDACRRHVRDGGRVVVQREAPDWYATAAPGEWVYRGVRYRLFDVTRPAPDLMSATIEYRLADGRTWTHSFTSRRLDDTELPAVLAASGLRLDRFLDDQRGWLTAVPHDHEAPGR